MVYGMVLVLVIIGRGWAILSHTKLHNMFSVQILIHAGEVLDDVGLAFWDDGSASFWLLVVSYTVKEWW